MYIHIFTDMHCRDAEIFSRTLSTVMPSEILKHSRAVSDPVTKQDHPFDNCKSLPDLDQ